MLFLSIHYKQEKAVKTPATVPRLDDELNCMVIIVPEAIVPVGYPYRCCSTRATLFREKNGSMCK